MNVELAHDAFAVRFHGANADAELAGDFFIAEAIGDVDEYFTFASGQLGDLGVHAASAFDVLIERGAGDFRAEERFTGTETGRATDVFVDACLRT